jgi:hypothetical protein
MNNFILLSAAIILSFVTISCNQQLPASNEPAKQEQQFPKTIRFVWREQQADPVTGDSVYALVVNEAYCLKMSDAERAALGYVATFIGSDCTWDEHSPDGSGLKCRILTSLGLGNQCSREHLGFLRKWFRLDRYALDELGNCQEIPNTATVQETFDEISVTLTGDSILVSYTASGINIREGKSWFWTQTDHFAVSNDALMLVQSDKSEPEYKLFGDYESDL